jgi:hypothetical protein
MPPPHPRPESLDSQQTQAKLFAHVLVAPALTYTNGEERLRFEILMEIDERRD